jgi:hypothetical protein
MSCVPDEADANVVGEILTSAGFVVGDSVEACEAFGPAATDAAVSAGPTPYAFDVSIVPTT